MKKYVSESYFPVLAFWVQNSLNSFSLTYFLPMFHFLPRENIRKTPNIGLRCLKKPVSHLIRFSLALTNSITIFTYLRMVKLYILPICIIKLSPWLFPDLTVLKSILKLLLKTSIMQSLKFSKFNLISTKTDAYFWRTNLFTRN